MSHRERPGVAVRSEERGKKKGQERRSRAAKGCWEGPLDMWKPQGLPADSQPPGNCAWMDQPPAHTAGEVCGQPPLKGQNQVPRSYVLNSVFEGRSHDGDEHHQWD